MTSCRWRRLLLPDLWPPRPSPGPGLIPGDRLTRLVERWYQHFLRRPADPQGLAAQVGDRVDAEGFTKGTVSNASPSDGQRTRSVAMYTPGHRRDAVRVATPVLS